MKKAIYPIIAVVISIFFYSCANNLYQFKKQYNTANALLHDSTNIATKLFMKTHHKDGSVAIIQDGWIIDTVNAFVKGKGTMYDMNRTLLYEGNIKVPFESIVIYETNKKLQYNESARMTAMGILVAANSVLTAICLSNPKACFGSCPTFYLDSDTGTVHHARAEGYSNAILPSLAYRDIDALANGVVIDGRCMLTMKNEALETHCTQELYLMAVPRAEGEQVYQTTKDVFYQCLRIYEPSQAIAKEGDITSLIAKKDNNERFSLANAENLVSREEIILEYDNLPINEQLGIVLNYKQTLMTTYLIYSGIGYMGDEVSDIYARIEQSREAYQDLKGGIYQELGDIEVYYQMNDEWIKAGSVYETGPIAMNQHIIPFPKLENKKSLKVKLVLNEGLWRIDAANLTVVKGMVEPIRINPSSMTKNKKDVSDFLLNWSASSTPLVSLPGEVFTFNFDMPDKNQDYELFLASKGYYIEWARQSWLGSKDLLKLRQMMKNPKKYLKKEAKNYKEYERDMEAVFWNSKICQPII